MSAPNYAISRPDRKVDPRALRQPIIARVNRIMEAHNKQYPLGVYSRAYYKRFKESELSTFYNILQAWSIQAAKRINAGKKTVDNVVYTNNLDARKGRRCKRGTAAHLGKCASVGLLLGRKATEDDAKQYQDRPKGTGCGWLPLKLFRGSKASYGLLIAPEILEGCLPKGILLVEKEGFSDDEQAENRDFENLGMFKKTAPDAVFKGKNMPDPLLPSEPTIKKEEMIEAVSDESDGAHADGNTFDGNRDKAANPPAALQKDLALSPAAAQIAEDTAGLSIGKLAAKGQDVAKFALMLLQFYLQSLATAMKRTYGAAEIERGRMAAIELLLRHPETERDHWIDEYTATIDRMAGAIRHDPDKWAAPPGQWLHPDCGIGIRVVRDKYLIPWRKKAKTFDLEREMEEKARAAAKEGEKAFAQTDWYAHVAWEMKNQFMRTHPTDSRIKQADLVTWREQVKGLVEKDLARTIGQQDERLKELVRVWNWFVTSRSDQAEFWRKEVGYRKKGLRSAGGFRRNFATIRVQCIDQEAKDKREKRKKTTIPPKQTNPKVLPSNTDYNPWL
jgi:hypothetical protein